MKRTRRSFLKMFAAGSAAALVPPVAAAATARRRTRRPVAPKPVTPATKTTIEQEIEKQKGWTAEALKVIRGYPLPPGSDMAFVFRPLRAPKRRSGR